MKKLPGEIHSFLDAFQNKMSMMLMFEHLEHQVPVPENTEDAQHVQDVHRISIEHGLMANGSPTPPG